MSLDTEKSVTHLYCFCSKIFYHNVASLHVFAHFIDPLSQCTRPNTEIKVTYMPSRERIKLALFADDAFYFTQPSKLITATFCSLKLVLVVSIILFSFLRSVHLLYGECYWSE